MMHSRTELPASRPSASRAQLSSGFEVSVEVARSATARDQSPYLRDVAPPITSPEVPRTPWAEPLRTRVVPF